MHEPPFLSPQVPPDHMLAAAATVAGDVGGDGHERPTRSLIDWVRTWVRKLSSTIRGGRPARRG